MHFTFTIKPFHQTKNVFIEKERKHRFWQFDALNEVKRTHKHREKNFRFEVQTSTQLQKPLATTVIGKATKKSI